MLVPRAEHEKLTFLNDQYLGKSFKVAVNDRAEVEALATSAPEGPLHFIFHTGFCCSTLLVNALTVPGRTMGLKEPIVLNDLALRMTEAGPQADDALLRLTLRLFARPFDEGEAVIAKASNVANRLIGPTLDARPASRAILLYSDLPSMLAAVARQGLERRIWARQLFVVLSKWISVKLDGALPNLIELPDLPLAALAWFLQVQYFREIARRYGEERVLVLDSADLLARPYETLSKASAFLDLGLDAMLDEIVQGRAFRTHSKRIGAAYSIEDRNRDLAAVQRSHGSEIQAAMQWLDRLTSSRSGPPPRRPRAAA